jgi:hypothetical protein
MRRKEEWARPEWTQRVNQAVEKASVERDSSELLIGSAQAEFEEMLDALKALAPPRPRAAA